MCAVTARECSLQSRRGQINSNQQTDLQFAWTVNLTAFCPVQEENEHMPFVSIFSTRILNPIQGEAQPKQLSECHLAQSFKNCFDCKGRGKHVPTIHGNTHLYTSISQRSFSPRLSS